jgi:hypothetical protein
LLLKKPDKRFSHTKTCIDFSEQPKIWYGCGHVALGAAIKFFIQDNFTILCQDCIKLDNPKVEEICIHCVIENMGNLIDEEYELTGVSNNIKGIHNLFKRKSYTDDNRLRGNYWKDM